jgi:hypothetical protein
MERDEAEMASRPAEEGAPRMPPTPRHTTRPAGRVEPSHATFHLLR